MMRMTCDQALCTLKDGLVPGYHQFGGTTQNLRGAIKTDVKFVIEIKESGKKAIEGIATFVYYFKK